MNELDSKHNLRKVAKANKLAKQALERYGEPTMTLAQLRAALDEQLKGISLSDLIVKEREAGW